METNKKIKKEISRMSDEEIFEELEKESNTQYENLKNELQHRVKKQKEEFKKANGIL